jgi:hypothetical protein
MARRHLSRENRLDDASLGLRGKPEARVIRGVLALGV